MPLFPGLAIVVPLLGAGVTLALSLLPRLRRHTPYIALTAVGFATVLILTFRRADAALVIPSLWQPSLLFGTTLTLQNDAAVQPLTLALALVTSSALLVELSRADEPRPRLIATVQALLTAGFVVLWAANLLTMLISWAIYDLLHAAGHITAGGSPRTAVRGLIFGGLATLFLWAGALLSGGRASSELWSMVTLGDRQATLWAVAGMLRLWAYPFHLPAPDDLGAARPSAAPLLLGPVMGWALWLRIVLANGGTVPAGTWIPVVAAITLAMGGFLGWSCESPRRTLSWVGMGATGAVLLAAALAGESAAAVIAAGSVAWALGVGVMFLGDGLQRDAPSWGIPSLVGALALLGAPPTLGFVTQATLLGGLTGGARVGWGGAFFVGNLLLVPSLARSLLASPSSPLPHRRWPAVARGAGLGLPALLLIVAGLRPPLLLDGIPVPSPGSLFAMPHPAAWLLWAISFAGGGVLAWQEGALRPRVELLLGAVHDLLRLEWLYGAVVGALDRGLGVLRAADEVVGGGGALLWSWLLFLLILLIWGSR